MVAPDGGEEKGLNVRWVLAFVRGTGGSCLLLTVTVPKSSDIQPEPTRLWRPPDFIGAGASTEAVPTSQQKQKEMSLSCDPMMLRTCSSQRGMRPQVSEGEYFGGKTAHLSSHKSLSRNQVSSHSTEPPVTLEHLSHIWTLKSHLSHIWTLHKMVCVYLVLDIAWLVLFCRVLDTGNTHLW